MCLYVVICTWCVLCDVCVFCRFETLKDTVKTPKHCPQHLTLTPAQSHHSLVCGVHSNPSHTTSHRLAVLQVFPEPPRGAGGGLGPARAPRHVVGALRGLVLVDEVRDHLDTEEGVGHGEKGSDRGRRGGRRGEEKGEMRKGERGACCRQGNRKTKHKKASRPHTSRALSNSSRPSANMGSRRY